MTSSPTHPRDERIAFDEPTHTYTIDGSSRLWTSATTFIKQFFYPFNADRILKNMKTRGTFEKKYGNVSIEHVKTMWSDMGRESAKLGTELHARIEDYYNKVPFEIPDPISTEWNMFLEFTTTMEEGWVPYRAEWRIFDEDYYIAGSMDMIFTDNKGKFAIYDWKRSKEIQMRNMYGGKAKSPIRHMDDCNYIHYSLQLNLYKYILESKYGMTIDHMALVIMHPNHETFKLIPIQDMGLDIVSMLQTRKKSMEVLQN